MRKEIVAAILVASCLMLALFSTIVKVEAPVQPTQYEPTISLRPNYFTTYAGNTFLITCMVYDAYLLYGVEISARAVMTSSQLKSQRNLKKSNRY